VHIPALQTLGHAVPLCQVPVLSQVCGVFAAAHWIDVGVHIPVHTPPSEHTYAHGAPVTHWPLAHVCGALPTHCVPVAQPADPSAVPSSPPSVAPVGPAASAPGRFESPCPLEASGAFIVASEPPSTVV
jgi:hypothetical protein